MLNIAMFDTNMTHNDDRGLNDNQPLSSMEYSIKV